MNKATLNLDAVVSDFNHWRGTRLSSREGVPGVLQKKALALLCQYKQSQVISALALNHSTLKRWRVAHHYDAGFVQLPSVTEPPHAQFSAQVTIDYPNGCQMQIKGLNSDQLTNLVRDLTVSKGKVL